MEEKIELAEKLIKEYKLYGDLDGIQDLRPYKVLKLQSMTSYTIDDLIDLFLKGYTLQKDYIPVSLVEEKIEELNKNIEKYREYTELGIETNVEWVDNVADRQTVNVLQDLLEKR